MSMTMRDKYVAIMWYFLILHTENSRCVIKRRKFSLMVDGWSLTMMSSKLPVRAFSRSHTRAEKAVSVNTRSERTASDV